jgi:hypothetical protein
LINEEDEDEARRLHAGFCSRWNIDYPLHSSEIRAREKNFAWLGTIDPAQREEFMLGLTNLIINVPALGHGCTIDRPGYATRYQAKYGRQTWMLCKTAFTVICERAAKLARIKRRKLRVFPERSGRREDELIREYYDELKTAGMPFAQASSSRYEPLSAIELRDTLYELKFKSKSSPLAQLADLYLYPIARAGYEKEYRPHVILRDNNKLIDSQLDVDKLSSMGLKYSCFDKLK